MNVVKLYATPYMEAGNSYASYISDKQQLKVCHYHDYYEVFLVDQGYAMHHVNGKAEEISTGMLFFTRPDDIHYYDSASDNFRIINIIIDTKTINALMNYLDDEKLRTKLLDSEFPPSITLDYTDLIALIRELQQLVLSKRIMKDKSDARYKSLIFRIITKYFGNTGLEESSVSIPQWMNWLILEMTKKENFSRGLSVMYKLSGKTPEHLSRSCRKYLGKTPTEIINTIRLEAAAHEMITTNKAMMDIAAECGFESISYFCRRFREYYGKTPKEYRKTEVSSDTKLYTLGTLALKTEIPASLPLDIGKKKLIQNQ